MFAKKQKGFTLLELLICIFGICVIIGAGFAIYAAVHFVLKFW